MGLFDLFKGKEKNKQEKIGINNIKNSVEPLIPEEEKKYYQDDSYYTEYKKAMPGAEPIKVQTFEERKKTSLPSKGGLYVAEILLIHYCTYGSYPNPKNGYPGFWWFEYGIRNVGYRLKDLEERGYIELGSARDSIKTLKVDVLKKILLECGLPTTGKKAVLVECVQENIEDAVLLGNGCERKYFVTELGQKELNENQYVPYMHSHPRKTIDGIRFGNTFNIWSINKIFAGKDIPDWENEIKREETRATGIKHVWETPEETEYYNTLNVITQRIPLSKIKNAKDWQKGFDEGFPFYLKAQEYYSAGNYYAAIDYYNKARAVGYDAPALYNGYVDAFKKIKAYDEAISVLKEGITRDTASQKSEWFEQEIQKIQELKMGE